MFSPDRVLEIRNASGVLHVARKAKHPDEWDPPIAPYDLYGSGSNEDVFTDEDDASSVETDASAP